MGPALDGGAAEGSGSDTGETSGEWTVLVRDAPGLIVIDKREDTGYMTPKEAQGEFPVFVSRIRNDPTVEHGLNIWVVADNLRKGAALNAVQIAEALLPRLG